MTKTDKIILWTVAFFSLFALVFQNVLFSKGEKTKIVIESCGKVYASYEIAEIREKKEVNIETEFGKNTVVISNEGAEITDADCKDRACLGKVSKNGDFTVCLPHKLIVRAEGIKEVDGVAY